MWAIIIAASMCGQRARMAWSWACSSAWRWSGRVSSQRVIWRVFGIAGGRAGCGEAAGLLRESAGSALPDAAVAALVARTEGWAAGLQLAALSLRGRSDIAEFVAAFSGSHRYVLDYLTGEVLDGQSEQVREFLLETSVLERLSGGLCDAVTGRDDGQAMLEHVEQAGLFLMPLDEVRGWWRYHRLFADLLRARLQQQRPGRVAVLHRAAAAWYSERGLADDAVRHALAAGDTTWAARLIEQHFDATLYLRSEGEPTQRWLAALPAELVESRPRLLLAQALLAATLGRAEANGRAGGRGRARWQTLRPRPGSLSSHRPERPPACWGTYPR